VSYEASHRGRGTCHIPGSRRLGGLGPRVHAHSHLFLQLGRIGCFVCSWLQSSDVLKKKKNAKYAILGQTGHSRVLWCTPARVFGDSARAAPSICDVQSPGDLA
jgi:hypothetical protein